MAKDKPVPTPIADIADAGLRQQLIDTCTECRALTEEISSLEAAKKQLLIEIADLSKRAGTASVVGSTWELVKARGSREDIDPKLLLEKGVSMEVIKYATVKKTWSYFQVVAHKVKEEG